jgi:hypothetical protein
MANVAKKATSARKTPSMAKPSRVRKIAPPVEFERRTLSLASDVARSLKIAAVVEHSVSESALVEVALRRFLALPAAEQAKALAGIGRRRSSP